MRELLTPHEPIRYRAGDFLALWRCDEVSGILQDTTGSYSALVVSGTIGNAGSLFASPAGAIGARTFSSSRATAAGNTAARDALLGSWTICAWVLSTTTGVERTVVAYAGGNTLASLGVSAAGAPSVSWRQGSTTVTATSTATLLPQVTYHLAAAKEPDPATAGRWRVRFYVDGAPAGVVSGLLGPDGGTTSPQWNIGSNGAGSATWSGTLDDIAVLTYAAAPEMVRDVYVRGSSSVDAAMVYASTSYEVLTRVTVYTAAGVGVDLSTVYGWDLLRDVAIEDDVDSQGATCRIDVVRDVYDVNVSPLMADSAPNVDAGGALLALNRRVVVETATVPDGTKPSAVTQWVVIFDGFVEGIDFAGDVMSVRVMDKILALQDVWIEPDRSTNPPEDRTYGTAFGNAQPRPVEGEIQKVIDDNAPSGGYVGGTPTLYVPTSPGWSLDLVTSPSDANVIGRIDGWVGQIGWVCRYRWDDHRKQYRLTLYEPERSRTAVSATFSASQILDYGQLEVSRDDIRNAVDVEYGSAVNPDTLLQWERRTIYLEDATSIAKYGKRYCRVGIGTNQEINDAASATRLANAIIADLKEPKADVQVELLYRHHVEVGDIVRLSADGQRFSGNQTYAVVGIAHTLSATERRTRLTLRGGSPVGRRMAWWDVIVSPGRVGIGGLRPLPSPAGVSYVPTLGGVRVQWTYPVNAGNRQYQETEIHRSTSSGFTPSSSTLVATVRGRSSAVIEQVPGTTQYLRLVHRDALGVRSAASVAMAMDSLRLSTSYVPSVWRQACHVRQSANQTWSATSAPAYVLLAHLTLVDLTSDTPMWFAGLQRIEVSTQGVYTLSASVGLAVTQAPSVGVGLVINGSLSTYVSGRLGPTAPDNSVSGTWTLRLDAGDSVAFALVADATKTVNVTTQAARTYVSGSLLFEVP